ncbi:L-2-hydroxyglutarate oxidase [Micrococcus terreus]|uniref:L-2-hydroxyglutarate oxidase LhgO n=1 Tax=Micrococcus terreus TaxID=574650 RepID=A0A1I7MDZ1_9MICC|nr:L-2-hydroxyglutarate oxidase [Micrococcus terreus]SFV20153.1 L-2-hydroxyglutarate oxidase LhgO [Micrococcus terreus]
MIVAESTHPHVVVVGAGILGLAVAREVLQSRPGAEVTVVEKEDRVAAHQTGHNSGVVHAGLYYEPGSLKARLCRRGVGLLTSFAREHQVHLNETGKLLIARNDEERSRLRGIRERAQANGVPDVEMLDSGGIRRVEPHATGLEALHSPHTAVIDYVGVCRALAAEITAAGAELLLGTAVAAIHEPQSPSGPKVRVQLQDDRELEADLVITCAGLQSDRLAMNSGSSRWPRIVPFSGDYLTLRDNRTHLVRGLIYPVPDPRYPFLGVHLTRMHDGSVLLGPNAFLAGSREGYGRFGLNPRDLASVAGSPGFWRFARQNVPAALKELSTATSRRRFVAGAADFVPEITPDDVTSGPRGIRAQAMAQDGTLVDDFAFSGSAHVLHVRNAPSPGATSALAIAEEVVHRAFGQE